MTSKQRKSPLSKNGGKGKKSESTISISLNTQYQNDNLKHNLNNVFKSTEETKTFSDDESGIMLHKVPFSCCEMPNFISDEGFLEALRNELLDQIFIEKNNDLYKFQQTDDLKKISTPHVKALRKLFQEDVLKWLKDVTGIPLSNKVDMTCSRYDYTDILLCHDDELEGRRIAFILYLVPSWKQADGGALDLFDMDGNGQPKDIIKSVLPSWNKFAWFEVTPASHHQVEEVLSEDKVRLSVNGWFHGPSIPRPTAFVESPCPLVSYGDIDEDKLYDWINPIYMEPEVQGDIQEKFENDSEIELQSFLKEEKYQELVNALKSPELQWQMTGPYNKRHYERLEGSLPAVVEECQALLQSEAMFLILSNLTGLRLHELAPNSDDNDSDTGSYTELAGGSKHSKTDSETASDKDRPKKKRRKLSSGNSDDEDKSKAADASEHNAGTERKPQCRAEVRRWSHGCYTLVHDTDTEASQYALDAMLFCSCKDWKQEYGGYTSYIAKGEDEELLTVTPADNSLALVYRDKDTLRFVKHINTKCKELNNDQLFYDLSLTYFE